MSDNARLQAICNKTYREQAVWFLNCFWVDFAEREAETLWQYVLKSNELDLEHHENGSALDEMRAHVFLEKFDETLTVRDMRDKLRSTGAIGQNERPKTVPLTHYLLYKYNADWRKLIDEGRQGGNKEEMAKAERLLAEVQAAFRESEARASEARIALLEAQKTESAAVTRENEAKAREAEAREAEAPFKAAQEEVVSALAEVHAQEAAYNGKIADCERRSTEGGVVQQNKAKAELAQLKAEDPLPLRKAKITLEAAEKRAAKARAPFEAATKVAETARQQASQAREAASRAAHASEQAKNAADAALNEAARQLQEAQDYLEEVKSKPGASYGSLWWIDRELFEQRKYLPTSKGGIAK